jgi:putative ABC transport system permease protein
MFKNHLKIALRSLFKQKGLAFINIFGLSVGFACFCLFLLYTVHEFSFDQFHADNDRIYRLYRWTEALRGDGPEGDPHLPMPLAPAFKANFPDVEAVVRWKGAWGESFVKVKGNTTRAEVSHVEKNVFDVFSFPLKYGDAATALSDPKNVVLTEKIALQLFGESNPTGKTIEIQIEDTFEPFIVSAVAENLPTNSSQQFQILGSFDYFASTAYGKRRSTQWGASFLATFIKLREGSGLATDAASLLQFREQHYPDLEGDLREAGHWTGEGAPVTYRMQPMKEMHTDTAIYGGSIPTVNPRNIWIMLAIATGVLLIAIINFTTLAIGRSAGRAKEVGIRKVIGSKRRALMGQFMTEALFLSVISVLVGLGLAQFALPFFNTLSGRELVFSIQKFPQLIWLIGGVTLLAGVLAGSYPAIMLSSFKPIEVLKNKVRLGGANLFTKSLVTTQFALSSALVIATLVIISQLQYLRDKNPGFNKENVIVIDADGTETEKIFPILKEAFGQHPEILGGAGADLALGAGTGWSRSGFTYKGEHKEIYEYYVDDDYLEVMEMELLTGRGFEPNRQDGTNRSIIINESMMKDFDWTLDNAVGQEITGYFDEGEEGEVVIQPKVIGVVKDFNYRSLAEKVEPQLFHQYDDYQPYVFLTRLKEGNPSKALAKIEAEWAKVAPGLPFKYSFLDEDINRFYRAEVRYSKIVGLAGGISIFLACLGLMGLAALAAVNRTKEIGIRKVLGASVPAIIGLLSKDFLKLVTISFLIAIPIATYFLNSWLQNFAYRIEIQWWMFVLTGFLAIAIAFITVGLQSMRAALVNPVDAIKTE